MVACRTHIAALAIATTLFLIPDFVDAQEPATPPPTNPNTVIFNGEVLAKTVATLNSEVRLQFEDVEMKKILDKIAKENDLTFDSDHVTDAIGRTATIQSETAMLGNSLVDLFVQIDCKYTIRPDGVIEIQTMPNPKKGQRAPSDAERYTRYAEGLVKNYDADKDGKLSKEELKRMRRPPIGADANQDDFITVDELVDMLIGRNVK